MNSSDTVLLPVERDSRSTSSPTGSPTPGVLARGHARQHPVHHHDGQRIPVGEVLIRLHRQLALIIRRANPRPSDLDPPAAQGHRPALVTVALGRPIRVVPALRADDLLDLSLHQLVHHTQPDPDAQRQQPLPRDPDQLAERLLNLRWERPLQRLRGRDDLRAGYLLHGGSSCPLGLGFSRPERSQPERTGQEDRHSNFYENSDNLALAAVTVGLFVRLVRRRLVRHEPEARRQLRWGYSGCSAWAATRAHGRRCTSFAARSSAGRDMVDGAVEVDENACGRRQAGYTRAWR